MIDCGWALKMVWIAFEVELSDWRDPIVVEEVNMWSITSAEQVSRGDIFPRKDGHIHQSWNAQTFA